MSSSVGRAQVGPMELCALASQEDVHYRRIAILPLPCLITSVLLPSARMGGWVGWGRLIDGDPALHEQLIAFYLFIYLFGIIYLSFMFAL